jgi:DNA-directed RNA polymerase specialized sigma24 family protein
MKVGRTYGAVEVSETSVLAARAALQEATGMNETSLLAAAKNGETAALDTLCRAHAEKLFRTVHRITRNREEAEDAVHDSLLRAFLHLKSFDGRSTFSTWLTRIGINSALMIIRKKRSSREVSAGETLWDVPDSAPNLERQYLEHEGRRIPRNAIKQPPPCNSARC